MSEESRLAAMRDGVALGEAEARELWKEFSAHMDAHEGDMAGFARSKGWFAVAPEYRHGKAVLLVTTTEAAAVPVTKAKPRPRPAGTPKPRARPAKKRAAPQRKGGAKAKR